MKDCTISSFFLLSKLLLVETVVTADAEEHSIGVVRDFPRVSRHHRHSIDVEIVVADPISEDV